VNRVGRPAASSPVLRLRTPVLLLVLAFTAVPADLRSIAEVRASTRVDWRADPRDVVANVGGYVLVGVVLAGLGPVRVVGAAAGISGLVETSQIVSRGRFPSPVDLATNVLGAALGWFLVRRTRLDLSRMRLGRRIAWLAIGAAAGYMAVGTRMAARQRAADASMNQTAVSPGLRTIPTSPNGATRPGGLEGHWPLDIQLGNTTPDISGRGLDARTRNASLDAAMHDRGVRLEGSGQYVDLGSGVELRLTGGMTIAAWVRPRRFPLDDAPIVSNHSGIGYQLDITADRGFRTVGFKLAAPSGRLFARYGRTLITPGEWYHVAGVYDAPSRALNVYVNGVRDDGCLLGPVPERQQVSGLAAYIGRRADRTDHTFIGVIDDVRIYSKALSERDVQRITAGESIANRPVTEEDSQPDADRGRSDEDGVCLPSFQAANAMTLIRSGAFGMLVAVAWMGITRRSSGRFAAILVSAAAGLLLLPTSAAALPRDIHWIPPVLSALGGSCIALSVEGNGRQR
jgi:VanZ family protein